MLERIIGASSNPGDVVLDCFAGSGTTLGAADNLGRRWVGVDNSPQAIAAIVQRFTHGLAPMGDFVSRRGQDEATEVKQQRTMAQMALFETKTFYDAKRRAAKRGGFRLFADREGVDLLQKEFVAGLTAGAVKG